MSFNRNASNIVHLKRARLREIVTAVQELEKKGYECMAPIKKSYYQGKNFSDKAHLLNGMTRVMKKHYADSYETIYYETYMKKVE